MILFSATSELFLCIIIFLLWPTLFPLDHPAVTNILSVYCVPRGCNNCLHLLSRFMRKVVSLLQFFFPFIFISWRLITLQYCSGFCHTLTWISHGSTCVPHPNPPSHLPLYPVLFQVYREGKQRWRQVNLFLKDTQAVGSGAPFEPRPSDSRFSAFSSVIVSVLIT